MNPPTHEIRSDTISDVQRAQALKLGPDQGARYVAMQLEYGGRRFCVMRSSDGPGRGSVPVVAIRLDLIIVDDFEERPPDSWLRRWPHRISSGGIGYHVYRPTRDQDPGWQPSDADFAETKAIRDRRYATLSTVRGYWHERIQPTLIFRPAVYSGHPGYRWALDQIENWHHYAASLGL